MNIILRTIKLFFSPSQKISTENNPDVYSKLIELEEKYNCLLIDVKRLEEENIETSNCIYELQNSIEAVDARIDILNTQNFIQDS